MSRLPTVRHAFTGKCHQDENALFFELPSRTKQSFKDECDINVIMARFQTSGMLDYVNRAEPQYLDTSDHDFATAMNVVAQAQTAFAELPSSIRERFGNNPKELLTFLGDEKNRPEAEKMGLAPKPAPEPLKAPPATPPHLRLKPPSNR